jgi:4,5-dihydroxyphthalate decarboxylase
MSDVELSFAIGTNPRSRPVLTGQVKAQGITLHCSAIHGSEIFWRQLAFKEFEMSEMSMSSLLMARSHGDDTWIGLPVFTSRMFFHTGVLVSEKSGITRPEELNGKKMGVPEYQQTAALWSRGILQHEYGVDPKNIEWYMERPPERSHGGATGFKPPAGVSLQYIPTDTDIGEMLVTGELDATLLYLSNANNLVDRSSRELGAVGSGAVPLFPDKRAEASRYFQKTGLFPVNHCVAVRKDVVERYPWVMLNLYSMFLEAKQIAHEETLSGLGPFLETGVADPSVKDALQRDLFPYGVRANIDLLETITAYSHEQGLTDRQLRLDEVFYPPSLEL